MFAPTRFLGIVVLGLGMGLAAAQEQRAPQKKVNPTVAAVLKLADNLDQKDVSIQAKKIVDQFDPCDISLVFTLKRPQGGGVGIGSAVKAGHKDSIESLVKNWSGPQPPTKEELQTHRKDLLQVARVCQAMAELAPHRRPFYVPKGNEKKAEEWRKVAAEFKMVTRAFRDSIEKGEPSEVRKAAVNLTKTCNACHTVAGI